MNELWADLWRSGRLVVSCRPSPRTITWTKTKNPNHWNTETPTITTQGGRDADDSQQGDEKPLPDAR